MWCASFPTAPAWPPAWAPLRDGYYIYDENHYEMVNETTGRTFKLGQKVTVKVVATNKILRTIDFELSEGEWENGRTKKRKPTDFQ